MEIKVEPGKIDKAIKILKKKMIDEGIIKELRSREYYEKPSVRRKREKSEAIRRAKRAQKMREDFDRNIMPEFKPTVTS